MEVGTHYFRNITSLFLYAAGQPRKKNIITQRICPIVCDITDCRVSDINKCTLSGGTAAAAFAAGRAGQRTLETLSAGLTPESRTGQWIETPNSTAGKMCETDRVNRIDTINGPCRAVGGVLNQALNTSTSI